MVYDVLEMSVDRLFRQVETYVIDESAENIEETITGLEEREELRAHS